MADEKTAIQDREIRYDIPAADIHETADGIVVVADMPGVDRSSLDITVERSTLTITGKAKRDVPEGYEILYSEFDVEGYRRSFTVSDEFDLVKVRADFRDGVLRISIPRSESAKPKKIKIN